MMRVVLHYNEYPKTYKIRGVKRDKMSVGNQASKRARVSFLYWEGLKKRVLWTAYVHFFLTNNLFNNYRY